MILISRYLLSVHKLNLLINEKLIIYIYNFCISHIKKSYPQFYKFQDVSIRPPSSCISIKNFKLIYTYIKKYKYEHDKQQSQITKFYHCYEIYEIFIDNDTMFLFTNNIG